MRKSHKKNKAIKIPKARIIVFLTLIYIVLKHYIFICYFLFIFMKIKNNF